MRRIVFPAVVLAVLLASCGDADETSLPSGSTTESTTPSSSSEPSVTEPPSPSASTSPSSVALPDGMPATYSEDVSVRELPADELIPIGDEVVGVDPAHTNAGEAVVVVFTTPGHDPFTQARGFVVWRRSAGAEPPWRAVYGLAHGKRDGVLAISADATDLTGDASDDALIREETGGSGACATYRVIDLAAGAPIWKHSFCDAEVQPNPDPLGLYVVARVYEPGDPHCCPSAISERVLAWRDDRFVEVSELVNPTLVSTRLAAAFRTMCEADAVDGRAPHGGPRSVRSSSTDPSARRNTGRPCTISSENLPCTMRW